MKTLYFLLFTLTCSTVFAQEESKSIAIGNKEILHSKILNENREIFVHVPENYDGIYQRPLYPVVYVMDGEAHFNSVVGIVEQLSRVNGNKVLPEMIVVGIANTNRMRDLSPSKISKSNSLDSATLASTGGGENFTRFLEQELIPHIDSLYTAAPYRIIIGHSLGGLMVIDELVNHTKLFNAYISIDPSMWWDNQKLLNQAKKDLFEKKFENKTLFLAMANTMKPEMDTTQVRSDTTEATEHIRSILELKDALENNSQNDLKFNWKYYPNDDHGSVPLIATYDGLRFIFDFTKFYLPENQNTNAVSVFSALETYYKKVSIQMGYPIAPPEATINGYAYSFLQKNDFENAYIFFKKNIENYPKSFNVYDSMGDYYNTKGDKKLALVNYEKAVTIFDYQGTREKIELLKSRK